MIYPKELRIGNWVKYKLESPNLRLNGLSQMYVIDAHDLGVDYDPIPLTYEILEKCGFKKDRGTRFYTIQLPLSIGQLSINPYNGMTWLKKNDGSMNPVDAGNLHQLQNLYFALTGEELNYKP